MLPSHSRRTRVLAVLLVLGAVLLAPGLYGVIRGLQPVYRGVNDCGGDWMDLSTERNEAPRFSNRQHLEFLASKGVQVLRLPFRWEQVQPTLDGPFNPRAVAAIRRHIALARELGMQVILDPHNFARYTVVAEGGKKTLALIGEPELPIPVFARFWGRMSAEFRDVEGIYAYGLMNEPNNIVTKRWERASQAALDAIRANGDRRLVLVPGSNFSTTYIWLMCHGAHSWIRDPADNFMYEAHCYFESTGGGDYPAPYEKELATHPDPVRRTRERLDLFVNWCEENGVQGFLGEFGAPGDPRWQAHVEAFLTDLDTAHMGGTAWGGGERYPLDYPHRLGPHEGIEPPHWAVLDRHRGGRVSSLSRDFAWGYRLVFRRGRYLGRLAWHAVRGTASDLKKRWTGPARG